jgi:hypothetical protein
VIDIEKKVLGIITSGMVQAAGVNGMGRLFIRFSEEQFAEPIASQSSSEYKDPWQSYPHTSTTSREILVKSQTRWKPSSRSFPEKRHPRISPQLIEVTATDELASEPALPLPSEAINTDEDKTVSV